jgi:prolyl-tRNA synthetase
MNIANKMYEELLASVVEVVIDDRDERPGVKFKDADLIGFPYRITVGKTIQEGNVEFVTRATGEKIAIKPEEAVKSVVNAVKNIK